MAIVIDVGPLAPTTNAYVSVADIDAYVADRYVGTSVATSWAALTAPVKAAYLVNATRQLNAVVDWYGYKYSRDQGLDWPRYDVYVEGYWVDSTTFPQPVKDATCEMVVWAMQNDGAVSVSQNSEFDSIKVGPISINFNEGVAGSKDKYFPDIVAMLLVDYGQMRNPNLPGSNQIKTVRLVRA